MPCLRAPSNAVATFVPASRARIRYADCRPIPTLRAASATQPHRDSASSIDVWPAARHSGTPPRVKSPTTVSHSSGVE